MDNASIKDAEKIRALAAALLDAAEDDAAIDRAALLLKSAFEAENQAAQAAKFAAEEQKLRDDLTDSAVRRRSEDRRAYVSILTPLFTTAVLAGTLILQSYQFKQQRSDAESAARRQIDAAEDVRWNEAIKVLAGEKQLSPAGALLATFSQAPRYRASAYDMAQQLLTSSSSPQAFSSVFASIFQPVSWGNIKWIIETNRSLFAVEGKLFAKSWNQEKKLTDTSLLTQEEKANYDQLYAELGMIATAVAPLLKGPRSADFSPNFSATGFWDCDWKGVDLHDADMTGVALFRIDVDGANLSGITRFQGSVFFQTAWWSADLISPELLKYLIENNPYNPAESYGINSVHIAQGVYDQQLARLKKASLIP